MAICRQIIYKCRESLLIHFYVCSVYWIVIVSQDRCLDTMATGNSPSGADRTAIDFQVSVQIPWNAPEAYVMLDSPRLFMLDTAHIPVPWGRTSESHEGKSPGKCLCPDPGWQGTGSRIVLCDACRYAGCGCACVTCARLEYSTASVAAVGGIRNVSETNGLWVTPSWM